MPVVIVGILTAGAAIWAATSASRGPTTVTVDYRLEVTTNDYCEDFFLTGYDDIPYAEVVLVDGNGTRLGSSSLDGGFDTDTSCVFTTTFTAQRADDGTYGITVGRSTRGFLYFSESDIVSGVLSIDATLG